MELSLDRKFEIIQQASAEGYKGNFTDLFIQEQQALAQQQQQQQQPQQQAEQIQQPQQPMPGAMQNTTPQGTGDLVQSYQEAPPGLANNPVGENVSNVVDDASNYRDGGVYKISDMLKYEAGGAHNYEKVGDKEDRLRSKVVKMAWDKKQTGGYKTKYPDGGLRNHMMNYLHNTGRDTTNVNLVMNAIGQHESKNVTNKHQDEGGPGRGIFQYEEGSKQGANTAMNRTANFLKNNTDKNMKDFPELFDKYKSSDSQDFSKLSKKDQQALFIGDKIFGGTDRRNAFDNVVKGDKPTQEEVFQYWLKNHKGKVNGKVISKLSDKEIEVERQKWNNRTKNYF